jgi:hypothetical protein
VGAFAAGAAVAAAILIALMARLASPPGRPVDSHPGDQIANADVPLDVWMTGPPGGEAIHLLAGQLDQFEADLSVSKPVPVMDRQIDSIQRDIDNFWTEDSSSEAPQS